MDAHKQKARELVLKAWEPGCATVDGSQILNDGDWVVPTWGCDSLNHLEDEIAQALRKRDAEIERLRLRLKHVRIARNRWEMIAK